MPRTVAPDSSLVVDKMILDYLCHRATLGLLAERRAAKRGVSSDMEDPPDAVLQMIEPFITLFRNNHGDGAVDSTVQFRIRLLKFTTFFTRRYTRNATTVNRIDLDALRARSLARAQEYWADRERPDFDQRFESLHLGRDQLRQQRLNATAQLRLQSDATGFYGHGDCMSLLDLLPDFFALNASNAKEWHSNISDNLMMIMGNFMMQAVIEQYLVYGARGAVPLLQAFAWGWKPITSVTGAEDEIINDMFRDEDLYQERGEWAEKRDGYFQVLQPIGADISLSEHLRTIASRAPIENFEDSVLGYLEGLLQSMPIPVLEQLETGQLANFTRDETAALMQRARYFEHS